MCLTLVHFENFALLYSRVEAGAISKFYTRSWGRSRRNTGEKNNIHFFV
jgi:hypothetical protein